MAASAAVAVAEGALHCTPDPFTQSTFSSPLLNDWVGRQLPKGEMTRVLRPTHWQSLCPLDRRLSHSQLHWSDVTATKRNHVLQSLFVTTFINTKSVWMIHSPVCHIAETVLNKPSIFVLSSFIFQLPRYIEYIEPGAERCCQSPCARKYYSFSWLINATTDG